MVDRLGQGVERSASLLLVCVLLAASCTKSAVHGAVSMDALPPSMTSQSDDRHDLAGEWEYVDGAVARLTLDAESNGHDDWKDGRFETDTLIGHTWHGMWVHKENDQDGGCTVECSPDFSEGEGRWWISRIGADIRPRKGGTFHLSKKTALMKHSDTSPVSCELLMP